MGLLLDSLMLGYKSPYRQLLSGIDWASAHFTCSHIGIVRLGEWAGVQMPNTRFTASLDLAYSPRGKRNVLPYSWRSRQLLRVLTVPVKHLTYSIPNMVPYLSLRLDLDPALMVWICANRVGFFKPQNPFVIQLVELACSWPLLTPITCSCGPEAIHVAGMEPSLSVPRFLDHRRHPCKTCSNCANLLKSR